MSRLFAKIKIPRHVFLTDQAYRRIVDISANRGINETGGPTVGYATVDDALVVTNVSDPGPRGASSPERVTIDGSHATAFCSKETVTSNGCIHYLGDWHIHTEESAQPSLVDYAALKKLPKLNVWGYPIFSLVLSASLENYTCIFRHGRSISTLECSLIDERPA